MLQKKNPFKWSCFVRNAFHTFFWLFISTSNNTFIHEYKCFIQNKSFWRKIQRNGNEIKCIYCSKGHTLFCKQGREFISVKGLLHLGLIKTTKSEMHVAFQFFISYCYWLMKLHINNHGHIGLYNKNSSECKIYLICSNYQLNHKHTNIKSQLTHEDVHTHKHTKQQHQSVVQVLWLELSGYKRIM